MALGTAVAQQSPPAALQPPTPGGRETEKPPKQIPPEHTTKPQTDQRGTEQAPLVVKALLPPKSQEETTQDAADRDEKASSDWWMVLLTGLLAFITAVQTIVFIIQTKVFWIQAGRLKETIGKMGEIADTQSSDMRNSIRQAARAAEAMERSATAMDTSAWHTQGIAEGTGATARIMQDTAERELRAYLGIDTQTSDPNVIGQVVVNNDVISANVFLKNDGRTPAYAVKDWMSIAIQSWPDPEELSPPDNVSIKDRGISIINPGRGITLSSHRGYTISPILWRELYEKRKAIYVYGRVDYTDAFKHERFVTYRLAITDAEIRSSTFTICNAGNDAN